MTLCWIWQGALTNGYGKIAHHRAHRVYYERMYGAIPTGLELDHLCKQKACVNPDHVEPVTHTENVRRGPHTVLDWDKAHEIRILGASGQYTQREIAEKFGVTEPAVRYILIGKVWADEDAAIPISTALQHTHGERHYNAKLTRASVRAIRDRYASGTTLSQLAEEFGVSVGSIHRVVHRYGWKHV
ncbi:MAG: HNH endonuclease [Thermomicrobia bacterium]|nr:HNH endonuclease [Thermomicrobia bacterium]